MRSLPIALAAAVLALAGAARASAPAALRVDRDVVYATPGGVPVALDVYRPPTKAARPRPAVVLVHGGGFRRGDKRGLEEYGRRLAALGWVAFSVNYRLAPRYVFPAGPDDVKQSVRWIRAHAKRYGVDKRRIGALGSSAGANLAELLGVSGSGRRDRGARVAAVVSWSGPMDLSLRFRDLAPGFIYPYLGCSYEQCPETFAAASPITQVDRSDAPSFLANSLDELVPVENATLMADRLRAARVPVTLRLLPGSRHAAAFDDDVWADSVAFLRRYLVAKR
jgi:acetyl esterase/lipase